MDRLSPVYLEAVRSLSDRDMHIYTTEVERRKKSVGVTYLLWFFFGMLGVHKFYLNQWWGFLNIASLIAFIHFMSTAFIPYAWKVSFVSLLVALYLPFSLLIDLFTIPWQVDKANERTARSVLSDLLRMGQSHSPAPFSQSQQTAALSPSGHHE